MTSTTAIHTGHQAGGGLALALDPSVAFETRDEQAPRYCRLAHPTGDACAAVLAALEGAEACLLTNSGMSAISATLLSFLKPGDHLIAPQALYAATHRFVTTQLASLGISVTFVDARNTEAYLAAWRPETRVAYLESPSNPLLQLTDLEAVSSWARSEGIVTIADNTFASPIGSHPLQLGVDIVIHSATKYLAGHGDLLAGAILTSEENLERIRPWAAMLGCALSAQGAWLLRRGLYTVGLRFRQHCDGALAVARWLEQQPEVEAVYYPGLRSCPQAELASRQLVGGCGGVLSFELSDGWEARRFVQATQLATPALSLGEPRTLICHPATMLYQALTPCERAKLGVRDNLVRLAVGLEEPDDIIADLRETLSDGPHDARSAHPARSSET